MKKFFLQLIIFSGVFFLMWWGLSRIPWVDKFHIQKFTKERQEDLAELVLDLHRMDKEEITDTAILGPVMSIRDVVCRANYIDTSAVRVHVFKDKMINAFALPGGHIVVNTELIKYCDNPEMLAGVMAHEMAHIELDHVSRKLAREIGLSTIIAVSGGGDNVGVLKQVLYTLSSRGFDRKLETEADDQAVLYMQNAKADPHQLAMFLKKLSTTSPDFPEALQWMSTHPDTKERVANIHKRSGAILSQAPLLDSTNWENLKTAADDVE